MPQLHSGGIDAVKGKNLACQQRKYQICKIPPFCLNASKAHHNPKTSHFHFHIHRNFCLTPRDTISSRVAIRNIRWLLRVEILIFGIVLPQSSHDLSSLVIVRRGGVLDAVGLAGDWSAIRLALAALAEDRARRCLALVSRTTLTVRNGSRSGP